MGKRWQTDPTPHRGRQVPWSIGQVSVRQRLIELEFRNGFRLGGIESVGLIEFEEALGRRPSGRQWRRLGREIEVGQDGANGNGIGDEGDDAHRSTAGRADERQHVVDTRDEGGPARRPTTARRATRRSLAVTGGSQNPTGADPSRGSVPGHTSVPLGQVAFAELRLGIAPIELDPIEAVVDGEFEFLARGGFYTREQIGLGYFLTPKDMV